MGVQTYSLFNVAGLIDKDKNIYYVPQPELLYENRGDFDEVVADSYYTLFKSVCPPSSSYTDKSISDWSPEDRRLVVEGTIDNFRLSRGGGLALNYCIVYRYVSNISSYTGFFITSVRQLGVNSVELMLEPDHFTNFFYLQNTEEITRNYDPFNPVMRNCYVERQHYDRFGKSGNNITLVNQDKILGSEEVFKYKFQTKNLRLPISLGYEINVDDYKHHYNALKTINSYSSFRTFLQTLDAEELNVVMSLFVEYLNIQLKENYFLPIAWAEIEDDSVQNVYQYKAGLTTINDKNVSPVVNVVFPYISIPFELKNIRTSWIRLQGRLLFEGSPDYIDIDPSDEFDSPKKIMQYLQEIGANQYILNAFISKYSPLQKVREISFKADYAVITHIANIKQENAYEISDEDTEVGTINVLDANYPNKNIVLNSVAPAFLPISTKELSSYYDSNNKFIDAVVTENIYFSKNSTTGRPKYAPFIFDRDSREFYETPAKLVFYGKGSKAEINEQWIDDFMYDHSRMGFVLSSNEIDPFYIYFGTLAHRINEGLINIDNEFVEPLLEAEPYSFYSLELSETEQIIPVMRLFRQSNPTTAFYSVELTPIISYNEAYKIGLIPSYVYSGVTIRYYGEALVSTISSQLPMIIDSWLSYYTTNKSQMKSQYAIQSNSFAGSLGATAISGVFSAGASALKGGSMGGTEGALISAGGQLINSAGSMLSSALENSYAIRNIQISQSAKMGDMGAKPDTVKEANSDLLYSLTANDLGVHINHYVIDSVSYDSIGHYLERFGYLVNIVARLNVFDRIGLNYIKLRTFDFVEDNIKIATEQANAISKIFVEGVTLLHNKEYLHNIGTIHNKEKVLQGGDN